MKVNQVPVAFVVGDCTTSGSKGSFPVVQHGLGISEDFFPTGKVSGAAVSQGLIIYKVDTDHLDGFSADGTPHFQAIAGIPQHVDEGGDNNIPASGSCAIALQEPLVGDSIWVLGVKAIGGIGVPKGCAHVVGHLLDCLDHRGDRGFVHASTS